jgi:AraC-like DNA-binding protein
MISPILHRLDGITFTVLHFYSIILSRGLTLPDQRSSRTEIIRWVDYARFAPTGSPVIILRVEQCDSPCLHRHEFTEAVLVLDGTGQYVTPCGTTALHRGQLLVIGGFRSHAYRHTQNLQIVNVLISPVFLRGCASSLGGLTLFPHLFGVSRSRYAPALLRELAPDDFRRCLQVVDILEAELRERQEGFPHIVSAGLHQLIIIICRLASPNATSSRPPPLQISPVIQYIEKHYREKIAVANLTSIAHQSVSAFMGNFRKATGTSPIRYLLHLRIAHACRLLRESAEPIQAIAVDCGFNDSNYFARQFRRFVGLSARQYRRCQKEASRH